MKYSNKLLQLKILLFLGGILFVIALIMFLLSYILMVKAIKMIFNSTFTNKYKKYLEKDVPYIPWITSYICLVVGAIITAMVQSSSIITASMVPLVSSQVITLGKYFNIFIFVYNFTFGYTNFFTQIRFTSDILIRFSLGFINFTSTNTADSIYNIF